MNLTSLAHVRAVLSDRGIHPSKALGQNFLIDRNILHILLAAADVKAEDQVLEVGPGLGTVTEHLVRMARRVVAVEKDRRLFDHLRDRFKDAPNLELICADMLEVDSDALLKTGIHNVVSNLPYSVGSRVLVDLALASSPPERIVVTVQQEVADRLAAQAGDGNYGKLSVWLQLDYDIERVKAISPTCFWPAPEVRSEIVRMIRHRRQALSREERRMFHDVTTVAFTHRRKQLAATFSKAEGAIHIEPNVAARLLESMGLDPRARPENLSVEQWCGLAKMLTTET